MLSISEQLKAESVSGAAAPACKVKIKLKSGNALTLTQSDLWQGGFTMDDATSGKGSFDIGQVITNRLRLSLNDSEEQYSIYDFMDAEVTAWRGGTLQDETIELLQCGTFTAHEQKNPDSSVELTCLDNMAKTEIPYSNVATVYPASIQTIVQDICNFCGIMLATSTIDNGNYVVSERPDDEALTCRDVLHYAAQISGSFARCDALGRLEFKWYDETAKKHKITAIKSFTLENQDIIITGVQVTDSGDEKLSSLYGEKGYVLEISDNPLIEAEKAEIVASHLGNKIIGMQFRPLELSCILDPSVEAGDPAEVIDRRGNTYNCWITNMTYKVGSDTKITCDAETPSDRSAVRFSETTKAIVENRKKIKKERTEREAALEELNRQLAESSGMYVTAQKQDDGSTIYYMHDKATLEDSEIVWKLTAEAIGISTDGGKTYPYGLDVSGTAILERLYVTGLDADRVQIRNLHLKDISDTTGVALDTTLNGITSEVSKKVGDTEIISKINQSAEKVSINADKIEFTGSAKFTSAVDANKKLTDASTAAANAASSAKAANDTINNWRYDKDKTLIDGGNIAANTITAEQIAIGDFTNYATVNENDSSTIMSDQAIYTNNYDGAWIEGVDKNNGLRWIFSTQRLRINSFEINDILKFDFNVWVSTAQTVWCGIWFYDKSGTYTGKGCWESVEVDAGGNFKSFSKIVKISSIPFDTKYYSLGFEFKKYGTESRNCVQKVKINKITGRLQVGDGFIDSKGSFQIGPMASINDDKDVEFKKAIFVDYGIEVFAGNDGTTPYIDFHHEAISAATAGCDYTARVQNTADSWLDFYGRNQGAGTTPTACTLQAGQFRGTFAQASDQRLKKDIKNLDEGKTISMLMKYRPVRYRYINGVDTNIHHGLIAQEAQGIADWGLVDDRGEYLAINYIELIADLITVVQSHEKTIQKLLTERKEDDKGESDNSEVSTEL